MNEENRKQETKGKTEGQNRKKLYEDKKEEKFVEVECESLIREVFFVPVETIKLAALLLVPGKQTRVGFMCFFFFCI